MALKKSSRVEAMFEISGNREQVSILGPSGEIVHVPRRLLARQEDASAIQRGGRPFIYCYDGTPYITSQEGYQRRTEEVASAELEDGSLVELVRDPHGSERCTFAVWQNRNVKFANHLEDRDTMLVPLRRHDHILRNVVLPCGVAPYNTVKDLARRIRKGIRSCVEIPNPYPSLLAAFAVYTWIADRLPKAVYLLVTGLPESGKSTLLDTLRLFCRQGLVVGDISPAAFYEVCSLISSTLLIDEAELDWRMRRLLRVGSDRGHEVLRKGFGGEVYGPRVICRENVPDDPPLVSRCIAIRMTEHDTSKLHEPSDPEMLKLSQELQAQLLQFRFENYRSIQVAKVAGAERLSPRARNLLAAVAAPFAVHPNWCDLLLQSFEETGQSMQRSLPPDEAAVLDGLYAATHRNRADIQMAVGVLTTHIFEIYAAAGQTMKLEPRAVGAILDKFGIARIRRNPGWMFWTHWKLRDRVHELVKKYGLNLPPEFLAGSSPITCEYCERMWAPHVLQTDDDDLRDESECERSLRCA
jgi:hypothetical protein